MHLLGIIDHPTQPATLGEFSDTDIENVREVLVNTGLLR